MDAVPAAVASLLNAIQSASQAQAPTAAPVPALLALAGQDVSMFLLAQAGRERAAWPCLPARW